MVNDTGGVAAAGKNHIEHVGLIMHVSRHLTGLVRGRAEIQLESKRVVKLLQHYPQEIFLVLFLQGG
jgi:hypothetical protein